MPDILTRANQKHVLITPETCHCDKTDDSVCNICDGGLAVCSLCGAAEIELDGPCVPKRARKENSLPNAKNSSEGNLTQSSPIPDGSAATETIHISPLGLSSADADRLRQIQREVAERPGDENAMESACGEYNCPCHYQIGFLLEVIAKTTSISLPALRSVILAVIDDGDPATTLNPSVLPALPWGIDHPFQDVANDARERMCDEIENRLRKLR